MLLDLANTESTFHDTPPRTLHTPMHMCAPEALFNQPLSPFVDMWSMDCLVYTMHLFQTALSLMGHSYLKQ
jgi:hypothetical protein